MLAFEDGGKIAVNVHQQTGDVEEVKTRCEIIRIPANVAWWC